MPSRSANESRQVCITPSTAATGATRCAATSVLPGTPVGIALEFQRNVDSEGNMVKDGI